MTEIFWTCGVKTDVSGRMGSLESAVGNYSIILPLPDSLLKQICKSANIEATFSTNPDGTTELTLVNDGSSVVWQRVKLSVIESIVTRAVFKKSPDQIENAAKTANLEAVIQWTIYDYSGEVPGKPLSLFIYSRKDLRYLPLSSFNRISETQYIEMMQSFRNMLK